jgi:hypothetical protein
MNLSQSIQTGQKLDRKEKIFCVGPKKQSVAQIHHSHSITTLIHLTRAKLTRVAH